MKEQKTFYPSSKDIKREWVIVDAENQTLGRIASQIAFIIKGKHKTTYSPSVDMGDFVVVINADKVKVSGNKSRDKKYHFHSRYPGGLKTFSFSELIKRSPTRVLQLAVKGMLPHNRLGRQMINKLKCYAGSSHPHEAQQPKVLSLN
jgi:large subunit ribosomal protein L13